MSLTNTHRTRLATIADVMIPGDGIQPGARALKLHEWPVNHVLGIDPSRLAPLVGFLELDGPAGTLAEIEALAQRDEAGFAALGTVLANAYFMHPETRDAIGYPGQEARDSSVGLSDEDHALVENVGARGPIFRAP